ncbi:MAG: regulatory protein RecX [Acidobacteria bacterium]|jgi:regulatory protein|nr:MAG: regulatory protein RecX [Acidobacteriota bacterium]GIU80964.1 MAG: hypothetical protein KatS3mg006_0028 [Pyrinomonadaceae bacterium]
MSEIEKQIFKYSLRLLARRAYTIAEMHQKLLEKDWTDKDAVNKVLEKLIELGFLNDEKFAEEFIGSKLRLKPVGKRLLRQNLREKQVAEDIIKNVLEEIDEKELIEKSLQKRLRAKGQPKTIKELRNLQSYLISQGFDPELVYETIRKLSRSFEDYEQDF